MISLSKKDISWLVLRTPGSNRVDPLEKTFSLDSSIKYQLIDSIMAENLHQLSELQLKYNLETFRILEGRELSPREIACAATHNKARDIISRTKFGGVILEDDARILNIEALNLQVIEFLKFYHGKSAILNLTGFQLINSLITKPRVIKLFGQPNLAVGYALTPEAANSLLVANTPIKWVADWPFSNCVFYVPNKPLVLHGDGETKSIILGNGEDFRLNSKLKIKLSRISLITLLTADKKFISFREYFYYTFIRRFFWRLDLIKVKLF